MRPLGQAALIKWAMVGVPACLILVTVGGVILDPKQWVTPGETRLLNYIVSGVLIATGAAALGRVKVLAPYGWIYATIYSLVLSALVLFVGTGIAAVMGPAIMQP
jgi:hypothetical protein